jgi:hypothetical protein
MTDPAVTAHLAWLAHKGHAPSTIQARSRALHRLAAALPVPLLDATPADLAAWRASLTVTGNTVVLYAAHARGFYGWAARTGLLTGSAPSSTGNPGMICGWCRR